MRAKRLLEEKMKVDYEAYLAEQENPWTSTGPNSTLIDWSGFKGVDLLELGLGTSRPLGMLGCFKPGCENHPDVVEAQANAHRTAEYVAWIAEQRAMRECEAVNASGRAGEAAMPAASAAHTAAQREFARLHKDLRKGLAIVRPALSEEEREAELKSVGRE
jgi:hypothetical protein